jgi:hypothetical protein
MNSQEYPMETIQLRTHIGSDGLLKLEMPVNVADVDADVVVVYVVRPKPVDDDWMSFINETYGILADDPIERPAELPADIREEIL